MDALVGQWWAHSLGLGYLLPADHIKSNLKYAAERNYVKSFDPGELGLNFLSRTCHIRNNLATRWYQFGNEQTIPTAPIYAQLPSQIRPTDIRISSGTFISGHLFARDTSEQGTNIFVPNTV